MSTIEIEAECDTGPRDVTTVVGPEMAGTLMTPEEFDAIEAWDSYYVYELIHGVLVVSPPPLEQERDPNGELEYLLRRYRDDHPEGGILDATLAEGTIRTVPNRRRADRVIWAGLGRTPDTERDVPTIIVEFVSYGKRNRLRDYVEKRAEYLALGVREYLVFDRFRRTLTAYRADGSEIVIPADGSYQTPLLPGFELPVARQLKAADRWARP